MINKKESYFNKVQRLLSFVLVLALVFAAVPAASFAAANGVVYGDTTEDGQINVGDVTLLLKYIAKWNVTVNEKNADVNCDGQINVGDVTLILKYIAKWNVVLGPAQFAVNFHDGERLIETLYADKGQPLGQTPSVEKTSKKDGVFVGWYTDKECTVPFYAENPVTCNTDVYAKYDPVKSLEEILTIDSFSKTDVPASYEVTIKGDGDAEAALNLVSKDGTTVPSLEITDMGDGTYSVGAEGGFREGSSYEIELAEGFNFVSDSGEMPETVRTASFTVKKDIVDNMELSDDIKYIADTPEITYSDVDGDGDGEFDDTVDVLGTNMGINANGAKATVSGSGYKAGDVICFYTGTAPWDRVYTGPDASVYVGEPEVYVKVKSAAADHIVFTSLAEDDLTDVYDIPDVFPIKSEISDNKVNISALDLEIYAEYGIETPTLDYAKEAIAEGDFVAVYADTPEDESGITFGKITAYNSDTGEITFEVCTAEDITASRSIYVQPSVSGEDLVSEEAKQDIEETMLAQIEESGFAEEAAYTLATLSTKTDGFKNMENLREILLSDDSGKPLSDDEIELLNLGASFELTEGVELSVELITSGDELHFNDGVQLAIGIEAEFKVEAEDGNVVINLNATFIEELEIKPTVDGELTYKKILGIPIPNGVRVSAIVDVLNYTAYDFDVTAYTVAEEDKPLWDKIKDIAENPTEITSMLSDSGLIPDKYAGQLKKVGDIFEKIEEIEKKISDAETKYKETKETVEGYNEDLESLWAIVEDMHEKDTKGELFTKETWTQAAKELSKTNIAQELLGLTEDGITDGDSGVDNDVSIKSVEELMERYSEMLQKETDWVTLVDQNIAKVDVGIYVVNFMFKADFMIRANMSIALGSTLEYEVGKRYNFWFEVGLYKPRGGSTTMDLIDESLVFQFYVMGKLEIKMGAKLTIGVSLGSSDVAYVGIYAEVGPYVKLYGFFVYTYEQLREANTLTPVKKDQKMGALYLETGIYLIVGVEASAAMGLFEVSYDFINEEFPILTAGSDSFPYAFNYEPMENEKIVIRDSDGNSANGVTMVLPEQLRAIKTMTLTSGISVNELYDYSAFNISLSNPNFTLDPESGEITVNVPDGVRYMDCELRLTFKYGKMAFSDYDISVSIPLYWTNLSTEELSEYYTASVRVGNNEDGYETVWSTRVLKNTSFELPSADEIKSMIGYNELKYTAGAYAEDYNTADGIIEDTVYDFNTAAKTYSITVNGIEGASSSQTFTAKYGKAFDFTSLEGTGKNDTANGEYTIFQNVTTDATVVVGKDASGEAVVETVNLASPISERMAIALENGISAVANYADNTAVATFKFVGLDHEDVVQKLPKGDTADIAPIEEIALYADLAVKDITPAVKALRGNVVYTVTLGELTGPSYTVSFDEKDGSAVSDVTKVGGSLLTLPTPTKTGYTFGGWFKDDGTFKNQFTDRFVPMEDVTLYAKWTACKYKVSFNVNGGTSQTPEAISVTYGNTYGTLPQVSRTGYGFVGWFTAPAGGAKITETTKVTITAAQTLYAQWVVLKDIPESVFTFVKPANPTYNRDASYDNSANVNFNAEADASYKLSDFTVEYKLDGSTSGYVSEPKDAGTYIARVSRPADNTYAKFEKTYTDVLTIDKAQGEILDPDAITSKFTASTYFSNLEVKTYYEEGVDYFGDEGSFVFGVSNSSDAGSYVSWGDGTVLNNVYDDKNIDADGSVYLWVKLAEGDNYLADPTPVACTMPCDISTPESIWCKDGFNYKITIKTSNKTNAGTDAMIWTSIDECPEEMDRWDSTSGDNFEKNHTDSMVVKAGTGYLHRSSLENIKLWIKYVPKHSASGWHCEWIKIDVIYNGQTVFEGHKISVNSWFEDNTILRSYTMTTDGGFVQSNVNLVGYDKLPAEVKVSADSSNYMWVWDGTMTTNLFPDGYNAYRYVNAPVLSVTFGNKEYDKYLTRGMYGFTVDRAGLYEAMKRDGITDLVLKTAYEFKGIDGQNSVSEECREFTRNVNFTLN